MALLLQSIRRWRSIAAVGMEIAADTGMGDGCQRSRQHLTRAELDPRMVKAVIDRKSTVATRCHRQDGKAWPIPGPRRGTRTWCPSTAGLNASPLLRQSSRVACRRMMLSRNPVLSKTFTDISCG